MRSLILGAFASFLMVSSSVAMATTSQYSLDVQKSLVKWTGKKITGSSHMGNLTFKSGSLKWDGTKPVGGEFIIDMNSLTDEDMPKTDENNAKLVGHLKSDDFFAVSKFPTATFVIKTASQKSPGVYTLTGDLTIKDKTNSISFDAKIEQKDGGILLGNAKTTIDRTKFDVRFNSKAFFDVKKLGDKVILDEVELEMNLTAGNPKTVNM